MEVVLTRLDGGLYVYPTTPYLLDYLKYYHRSMEQVKFKKVMTGQTVHLYQLDSDGGLFTFQGFFPKLSQLILDKGDTLSVDDQRTPLPEIDWEKVNTIPIREYQITPMSEFFARASENSGVCYATGGFGKTFAQMFTYAAWHKLNTILAIPLKEVVSQTHAKFCEFFPDKHIGMVGNGKFDISTDITITSFRSLESCALEKCQLLLVDEIQAGTSSRFQETMAKMKPIRAFGYTATDDKLFNNADKLLVGLYGPRLIDIPYDDAMNLGAVVPCHVYILSLDADTSFTEIKDLGILIRNRIQRNDERNRLIGEVSASVPEGWQTIVFIDHIKEHLPAVMKNMPSGTRFIHRSSDKTELGGYALTAKEQKQVIADFKQNKFQTLIATDAFRAGVDVPNVRVVVQCAGGSSKVEVLQEAFRGSRQLTEKMREELGVEPKTHFILVDFLDNHDQALQRMAEGRIKHYESQGWKINYVNSVKDIDWRLQSATGEHTKTTNTTNT